MRDKNPTETQLRILNAALKLFAKHGYKATTTRAIADKADVNEITIFRNFNTKKQLFENVLDYYTDLQTIRGDTQPTWTGEPENDLITICRIMRHKLHQNRYIMRIMLRESRKNPAVMQRLRTMLKEVKGLQVENLKRILAPHVHKNIDWECAGVFLASYFIRSEIMTAMMGEDMFYPQFEESITTVVDMFLHGLLDGGEDRG